MNSNNNITNPKCSNSKCYFTPAIKSSGIVELETKNLEIVIMIKEYVNIIHDDQTVNNVEGREHSRV